jgi:hypothetical protein
MDLTLSYSSTSQMSTKLYYGDNLDILRKKMKDGTVDLCYIDLPFNTTRFTTAATSGCGLQRRSRSI